MKKLFKNNRGAAAVEFALVALPVIFFILGIMQVGFVVWTDNLLHFSVNTAARCGAVNSMTPPCDGSTSAEMINTANTVFFMRPGATFTNNSNCSPDEAGLIGTYKVNFLLAVNLTLTAESCYPAPPSDS
jgi:Flp pilus assembly protein TadG